MVDQSKYGLLLLAACCVCLFHTGVCYSRGPPPTQHVCKEMFPEGHKVDSQLKEAPYEILLSQNVYSRSMEEIRVTIKARRGNVFQGFFIQARRANCTHPNYQEPLGVFMLMPGERFLKTLPCFGRGASALSHSVNVSMTKTEFKWFAPATKEGHLYFVMTIVQDFDIFWTGVASDVLRENMNPNRFETCPVRKQIQPGTINTTPKPTTPRPPSTQGYNTGTIVSYHISLAVIPLLLSICILWAW